MAPLALVAVVVAVYGIVSTATQDGDSSSTASPAAETSAKTSEESTSSTPTAADKATTPVATRKFYVVQLNDSLSIIADKTGIDLERLQELNPDVDPHTMIAGQKIRLR